MITGCGIDIVEVQRFTGWLKKPDLVKRFFHQDEASYVWERGTDKGKTESLASHFAAKEAFAKALGTGFTGLKLTDMCVHRDKNGKPRMSVYGTALRALKKNGACRIHLSLSHEKCYAVAQVILESGE